MAYATQVEHNCALIILAAGSSERMGRPKQLLPYKGKSLLEHAVDVANDSIADPVIVVLGSNAPLMEKLIEDRKIHIEENKQWQEGMASSIRCGINTLLRIAPEITFAIIMLCDQPYVSSELLNELITHQKKSGKPIVSSLYNNTVGSPTLFHKTIFPQLLRLKGEAGARKIIELHKENVATITFNEGNIDIDTETDYGALT